MSAPKTPADQKLEAELQVGVDELNASGGLAGCQVKPVFYGFALGGDWTTNSQEECTTFTQDHHVVAAIPGAGFEGQNFLDCMVKKHTPVIGGRFAMSNAGYKKYSPYLYAPGTVGFGDYGAMIAALKKTGFLTSSSKVGILSNDVASDTYLVNKVLKPALKKLHIKVVAEQAFTAASSVDTLTAGAAQAPSAVLKFKQAGVDRIIGTNFFFFTTVAQSQNFHPKYAGLGDFGATLNYLPAAQLDGAVVVTGQPGPVICGTSIGGPCANYDNVPSNTAKTHCDQIYAGKTAGPGVPPQVGYCTELDFLRVTLKKAAKVTAKAINKGMLALGASFVSASGVGPTKFGPGLPPTGAARLAVLTYDPAKKAMLISGPFIKLP